MGQLKILYFRVFLSRIGFGSITIVFPLYLNANAFLIGLILAIYPLFEALTAFPIGRLVDRRGRRGVFVLGMITEALLTAYIGFTQDIYRVALAHGLMGISAAAITVSSLTMIGDATRIGNRGKGMGGFDFANLAGYGAGFGFGLLMVRFFATRLNYAFWTTAVIFTIAALASIKAVRSHPMFEFAVIPKHTRLPSGLKKVLPLWLAQTIIVGMYFILPKAFFEEGLTVPPSVEQFGMYGIPAFGLGMLVFGSISDRMGRVKTMAIGAIAEIGFLVNFGLYYPDFSGILYFLVGLFFLTSAIAPSILAYVGDVAHKRVRGAANALYSAMLSIGMAFGNISGGYAAQIAGIKGVFYVAAFVLTLGFIATATRIAYKK